MRNRLAMLAMAFAVATGLFWSKMLIAPPVSKAATDQGLNIDQVVLNTPNDMPSFEHQYQRHLGVLDVLK